MAKFEIESIGRVGNAVAVEQVAFDKTIDLLRTNGLHA